jgi:hypothetical protein
LWEKTHKPEKWIKKFTEKNSGSGSLSLIHRSNRTDPEPREGGFCKPTYYLTVNLGLRIGKGRKRKFYSRSLEIGKGIIPLSL